MPQQQLFAPTYYRELRWRRCTNNTQGSQLYSNGGCLQQLDSSQPDQVGLNIASGEEAPATVADIGSPVPWRMFTLYPRLPETASDSKRAWTLIGEVDKIVSVSASRFLSVGVVEVTSSIAASAVWGDRAGNGSQGGSCLVFEIVVEIGEVVTIGAVTPTGTYVEATFDAGGSQRFCD
jgi:hypothetical protein